MTKLRIATFNCENLFARFKFNKVVNPEDALTDGWLADKTKFTINDEESKKINCFGYQRDQSRRNCVIGSRESIGLTTI
jgi:hypothetical protein